MDESTEVERKARRDATRIRRFDFMRSLSNAYYDMCLEQALSTSKVDSFDPFDSFDPRYIDVLLSIEIGLKLCIASRLNGENADTTGHNLHQLFNLLCSVDKVALSIRCSLSVEDIEDNLYKFRNDFTNEQYIYQECLDCILYKTPITSDFIIAFASAVNTYIHEIPYPEY